MDTRSTKFNKNLIVKIIAFLMAVITLTAGGVNLAGSYLNISNSGYLNENLLDALLINNEEDGIYRSDYFNSELNHFCSELNEIFENYGDGSERFYSQIESHNEAVFQRYKSFLITNCQEHINDCYVGEYDYEEELRTLLGYESAGLISLKKLDVSVDAEYMIDTDVYINDIYMIDSWLNEPEDNHSQSVPNEAKDKGKEAGADCVILLPNFSVVNLGKETAYGGYYAVTVNEEALRSYLLSRDLIINPWTDYKEYQRDFKNTLASFGKSYQNINYIVRSSEGMLLTNVEGITVDSKAPSPAELEEKYDFVVLGDANGYMESADGSYIMHFSSADYDPFDTTYIGVTSAITTTAPAVTSESAAMTTMTTTMPAASGLSAQQTEGYVRIFFNDDAVFHLNSVESMRGAYDNAKVVMKDILITAAICCAVFLLCLIILMALSGRRSREDSTVYPLFGDFIFTDLRIYADCGLIFGAFMLGVNLFFGANNHVNAGVLKLIAALTAAAVGILFIDLVLFCTRKIKSKRFLKDISVVWIIRKLLALYRKNRDKLKEKFLYTGDMNKTVKVKTLILIGINIMIGSFAYIMTATGSEFFALILFLALFALDCYILYRGYRFVGGADKLFKTVAELRSGNLQPEINKNALPDYLQKPADDLLGLSEGLRAAVGEAVKQEQTKTELITNVSHDLKTPLTSIINYVDLLKKCDIDNPTALTYLEILGEKSDRLKNLIADLVEASKAATGNIQVNFVAVSLRELLSQSAGENGDGFEEKKLEVVLELPEKDIVVKADSKLLSRVLENLIGNIKKYALENTRVYISAEEQENTGVIVMKNISRERLNITPEELKQRFVRGDASRTSEGNGLGLSIAENLCKIQEGALDIEIMGDMFVAKVTLRKIEENPNQL
ncbi:MAG: HAMP domain-containing sensor histidine kinase [Oscillospiraceae bacterium]|nr:HAMP domain-containing sensor histidine kinase [Oscillospiraceae bacterium]